AGPERRHGGGRRAVPGDARRHRLQARAGRHDRHSGRQSPRGGRSVGVLPVPPRRGGGQGRRRRPRPAGRHPEVGCARPAGADGRGGTSGRRAPGPPLLAHGRARPM
ncbi:MAG: hypothetical protein AVDCRST_MAG50-2004, partial [uncultured Acidimicrobiales bacterium]